jgi:methylglutaconyl-CoA hydratase
MTIEITRPSRHVAEVWLNRPEMRNAFNTELIVALEDAFTTLPADPEVRVVVLGGRGKVFCAGADLNMMKAMAGDCYAGGMGLASVCDVLIAARGMQFCLSEARLGLLPATISPYVIRAMGEQAARRYFVTAERFDADAAARIGFVHEVVEPAAIDARVAELAALLAANGPAAVRACKKLVQDVAGRPIDAGLRSDTAHRIADIRASDEGREGVRSFLEKRPPAWLPRGEG